MTMLPTLNQQDFVAKWKAAQLSERSSYQQHFLDLCRLIGHPAPADLDPTGDSFTFEAGVKQQSGRQGWADVWKKGAFALEYKGKHANLDKAYQQLLLYREALHNPPLLIVCDIDTLVIHTNFTNTVKRTMTITLAEMVKPEALTWLRAMFLEPERFRLPQTTQQVTEAAAREFAKVADILRKYGDSPPTIAHFCIQLLFCLFAEDIRLLPENVFTRLVERTRTQPQLFSRQLKQLFSEMVSGGMYGSDFIPHVNGHLFDGDTILTVDRDVLDLLQKAAQLDWSSIEPAVFGTLFERSLDPAKRAQLGAHYTSRDDILLIIEPVLMAPLRRRWVAVQDEARVLAQRRDGANGGAARTKLDGELRALLTGFASEIAGTRVLDPACGSGNFLYVALKQLLDLEKEVITLAGDLAVGRFFPTVSPEQLRGIEVNEYAHELAAVTVWIGYLQWLRDNGFGTPSEPILKPLDTIVQMDALLAIDDAGTLSEPPWPAADVIVGNPPFLGGNKIRKELGDAATDHLFALYRDRVPAFADLVTYWFERARALVADGQVQRAGLLATNSIRGGANRKVLDRIKESGNIFMAWADRPWVLDGAAVRVSMVAFDDGTEQNRTLEGEAASSINADLTGATNLTGAAVLAENKNLCFMGPSPKAPFDISAAVAATMLTAPINVNGRPNSDVVVPVISAIDIMRGSRGEWTIFFGSRSETDAQLYEMPYEYIRKHVYPVRTASGKAKYIGNWWQYARPRYDMWDALSDKQRYIVTPAVAKHRVFVWIAKGSICNQGTLVIARDDDYFFGVLHSRFHEQWSLRLGTSLGVGNDPRYTPTTTFETYPFPWPPGTEPADDPRVHALSAAAKRLVELRDAWLNPPGADVTTIRERTLTKLYNARPAWLATAHQALDGTVAACYGWPADLSDAEILARLLALNAERASARPAGAAGRTALQ